MKATIKLWNHSVGEWYCRDGLAMCYEWVSYRWVLPPDIHTIWMTGSTTPLRHKQAVHVSVKWMKWMSNDELRWSRQGLGWSYIYCSLQRWLLDNYPRLRDGKTHRLWVWIEY